MSVTQRDRGHVDRTGLTQILLGLDFGTSGVKAVALAATGPVLGSRTALYPTRTPRPGWSEQDPDDWWQAAGEACRALVDEATARFGPLEILGIGLSGQMHTMVLVDGDGRPVRPAITWMDTRAGATLAHVRDAISAAPGLRERLANPIMLGLTLLPLIWLRDNERERLAASRHVLLTKDYVRYRLTGEIGSEPTDASATLLFDVPARTWSPALMATFGLSADLLPRLFESDATAGTLTAEAAAHLGLAAGIPVAFGAGDQQAAAVGMGTIAAGRSQLTVGTGAQVIAVHDRPIVDPSGHTHTFCHVRGWISQASINNAGAALSWVRSVLGVPFEACVAGLGSRDDGPTFLPYLTGERTPLMKGHARGAWIGLSDGHDREDLARAAGEGVVASIAEAIAATVEPGGTARPLLAAGGGMRNASLAQAIADASGRVIDVRESVEASGVGAALLAGVAVGVFAGLDDAVATLSERTAARYEPDTARAAWWIAKRRLVRDLDALRFHEAIATA